MTSTKTARRSFAGGEITPEMFGRLDNLKNQTGLALCRNGIVLPHGPVSKRPGTVFVNAAYDTSFPIRILPFAFSATQSMVLEFGQNYIRFHTGGGTLLEAAGAIVSIVSNTVQQTAHGYNPGDWVFIGDQFHRVSGIVDANHYTVAHPITGSAVTPSGTTAARVYMIASPYVGADLFALKFTQDADVLTITHPNYATRELRRLGAISWSLTAPALGSATPEPTGPAVVPTVGAGTAYNKDFYYKITTLVDGLEESLPTTAVTCPNDLTLQGGSNLVTWVAPVGPVAPRYRVYKTVNDPDRTYGYVGETSGLSFVDDNVLPDYSRVPPKEVIRLDTAGKYPAAVAYHDQRRVFAGPNSDPHGVYFTRVGTESNLTTSYPSVANDAVSIRLKAQQVNTIRHLVPLADLLALTASSVWRIFSRDGMAIAPDTVDAKAQSYDGANDVRPLLTGSAVLFVENSGKRVRDIAYSTEQRGYFTDDRSIMAPHLFNDTTLVDAAFQRNPDKIAWFVRSDGVLLSMTYMPEQQVFAWAQHQTDGTVESVCVVPEENTDVLYLVVRRTVGTNNYRAIERMAVRQFASLADAYYVDGGFTYDGAPTTTITGLWWLEGLTVVALADGGVYRGLTVSNGTLTFPLAVSTVRGGRPFTLDIQTLPLAVEAAEAAGQGTIKSISNAYLLVNRTGVLKAGPDEDNLRDIQMRTDEPYDSPPDLKSEEVDILLDPDWTRGAQMWVRSDDPVPCTLSALTMQVHLAG